MDKNPRPVTTQYNPIPRVNIPTRTHYPERFINPAIIQELFLRISEGDISRIKDFILTNNITLYVKDDFGNTVLHHVIKNSNFTNSERIELVKFLIDRGAPIVAYNNENITPLHLASKFQYEEIIDILLTKGADPNSTDNQFMIPLHYAIQGYNTDCKSVRKYKIDNLINDQNVQKPNEIILKLNNAIEDYLFENPKLNKYLIHFKRTLMNYINIYGTEYSKLKLELMSDINNLLSNDLPQDQLSNNINNKFLSVKQNLSKNLSNKLKHTLENFDIRPGLKSGPDQNKVLPYTDNEILNTFVNENKKNLNMNIEYMSLEPKRSIELFDNLFTKTDNIIIDIKNLYWYNAGFYINTNNSANNMVFEMKRYLAINRNELLIYDISLDNYNDTFNNNSNIYTNYLIDLTANNNISWNNNVDLLKIDKNYIRPTDIRRGFVYRINQSKNEYNATTITDDRNPADLNNILPDSVSQKPNVRGRPLIIIEQGTPFPNINLNDRNEINNIIGNLNIIMGGSNGNTSTIDTFGYIDYDYTIISKFRYYILRIKRYLDVIEKNNQVILNHQKSQTFLYIPEIIYLNLTYGINCLLFLKLLSDEAKNIKEKLTSLINVFDNMLNKNKNIPHSFYLDLAKDTVKNMNDYFSNLDTKQYFRNIITTLTYNNNFIKYINNQSFIDYVNKYNNMFGKGFFYKEETDIYSNLFDNVIQQINFDNLDYDKFEDLFRTHNINSKNIADPNFVKNLKKLKKDIIEKCIPQISVYSKSNYITNNINTSLQNNIRLLYDYVILDPTNPNYNSLNRSNEIIVTLNIISNPQIFPNIEQHESHPGFLLEISGTLPLRNIKSTNNNRYDIFDLIGLEESKPKLQDSSEGKIGNYGLMNVGNFKKSNVALAIVSSDINIHFRLIKYNMVSYFIAYAYGYITNKVKTAKKYQKKFKNALDHYNNYINNNLHVNRNVNNYEILLSTVGKLADNILIIFIKQCIETSALYNANTLFNFIENETGQSYVLSKITQKPYAEIVATQDYGFKLHLDEIIDEVVHKFLAHPITNDIINSSYQLNFTSLLLDNDVFDRKNIVALYNYSLNSQKIIKQCYSINNEVINKLIQKSQINKKDFAGNSPIFYAIETQNIDAINLLLSHGANVNINNVKNNIGVTPLEFGKKLYKAHVEVLNKYPNFITSLTTPIYDKLKEIIKQNPTFKNNIIRYADIFLPTILIIINHYLFNQSKNYPKNWSFEKMKNLSKIITGNENYLINPKFPLLNINANKLVNTGIAGTNVLMDKKKVTDAQINMLNNKIRELTNSNNSLEQELSTLTNTNNQIEINRAYEIQTRININMNNINIYTDQINKLYNVSNTLTDNKVIIENNNSNTNIPNILNNAYDYFNTNNVLDFYDNIFWKLLNNKYKKSYYVSVDYRSYPDLLKQYIYNNNINITLIQPFLQNFVYNSLHNNDSDIVTKINLISELYDNVLLPISKDYEELPLEYNYSNYALKQSIDIIVHSFKHTLLTSMYHSIIKIITKYLKSINPESIVNNNSYTSLKYNEMEYSEFINFITEGILTTKDNGESSLIKFIFDTLPLKLVKITLNIFDGENDPDRMYNRDGLYERIPEIIINNITVPINENSSLIKNIKEILIPYFKDFNDLFINEAKNLIDGYYGYIISESNMLHILSLLLNQSIKEGNIINN